MRASHWIALPASLTVAEADATIRERFTQAADDQGWEIVGGLVYSGTPFPDRVQHWLVSAEVEKAQPLADVIPITRPLSSWGEHDPDRPECAS